MPKPPAEDRLGRLLAIGDDEAIRLGRLARQVGPVFEQFASAQQHRQVATAGEEMVRRLAVIVAGHRGEDSGSPLARHEGSIRSLLRLTEPGASFAATGSVASGGVTVELDTAATIDVAAERRRLTKDLATAQADIEAAEKKLASPSFVERAPAQIVAKNRDRLAAAQQEAQRLTERLAALPAAD